MAGVVVKHIATQLLSAKSILAIDCVGGAVDSSTFSCGHSGDVVCALELCGASPVAGESIQSGVLAGMS